MAVHFSNNSTTFRLTDAIVINEVAQPSAPAFSGAVIKAHIVGEFPWGPSDELIEIKTEKQLVETLFGGCTDPEKYAGFRSLIGKKWGQLEIVRVEASDAAASARILSDGTDNAYSVSGKYKGDAGNQIFVKHTQVDATTFDLEVSWGTAKSEKFEGVTFDVAGLASIDSKYITLLIHVDGGTNPPTDAGFVALSGGSNGTLVDTDYIGDIASLKGLQVARTGSDLGAWFFAEYTSPAAIVGLLSAVNAKRGKGYIQAAPGDDFTSNETAALAVSDDRLIFLSHRAFQSIRGEVVLVDLAPFAACVMVNTQPNLSMAEARFGTEYLAAIVGVPTSVELSRTFWIDADVAGMCMLERRTSGGFKFHMAITSDSTATILWRRMTDFVNENLANALEPYANTPGIPENVDGGKLAMIGRLKLMKGNDQSPDSKMIESYEIEVGERTGNSIEYNSKTKLWGESRYIILNSQVGENVVITEA